jgi:N,N-dimethyl phenylurea N-demethylase beta subunit
VSALSDEAARVIANEFLAREAKVLDERRFEDWVAMLDPEIVYDVPVRESRKNYADETHPDAYRIRDDINQIKIRVARLATGQAWAEVPPSRTCRVVGSVLVTKTADPTVIEVESAMIMYRQRGHEGPGDVIPVRRTDRLRVVDGSAKLLSRRALLTEAVLNTPNLGVFL